MQRLHCWLDQLTLRRGRTREADVGRRVVGQSAPPSHGARLESRNKRDLKSGNASSQVTSSLTTSQESKNVTLSVPVMMISSAPVTARKPEKGSFARRRGIRTNPWLYGGDTLVGNSAYRQTESYLPQSQSLERKYAPPTLLGVKSLEESTCSSGYGSQDSSPDSSIHVPSWQTTDSNTFSEEAFDGGSLFEETSSFSTYDNVCDADDEHIYHELESCCRVPEQRCSSVHHASLADSRSSSPVYARPESPIYAQPWAHYHLRHEHRIPNIFLVADRSPVGKALTVRNHSFRRVLPRIHDNGYVGPLCVTPPLNNGLGKSDSLIYPGSLYSRVCAEKDYCETNERRKRNENRMIEETEEEFLSELDAQIAELQLRSDELRSIVEKACQRRHAANWLRPSMECTFELSI